MPRAPLYPIPFTREELHDARMRLCDSREGSHEVVDGRLEVYYYLEGEGILWFHLDHNVFTPKIGNKPILELSREQAASIRRTHEPKVVFKGQCDFSKQFPQPNP